ncbi:MAG: TIGR03749 family integrating conjugative element protein [Gammaproteobacteria bacterium CG11_big_fil_rev_8_21_14_0_20_46_22]|nr:MAG: TIGR03749 family integrating conjugative element protein [Gammaproteobacteria bacterium CG12_big_fil_rev_8_21_14_0_65_46_12]PIR11869.1 MAG: TIGR03749 family integrating conjugative element protein [Gammaproteobacteria bacterium CG11_big_fil_rev_8_21_14_0_20_46_22]
MNRLIKPICLASILLASLSAANFVNAAPLNTANTITANSSDEHIVWQRAPIKITLPVGKERFVSFPNEVQFGYNTNLLPPEVMRVENDNQTLYLFAKKPFSTERTEAKLASGEIILLDINAKKAAPDNPVDIVLPKKENNETAQSNDQASQSSVNTVSLTRYAIQRLYAPQRLLKQSMQISRFPMETEHVVPLFYDGSASAMPLASWRGGNLYVTALLVKNLLKQPLRLDPRLLCGDWKAASFYPQTQLASRGTPINKDTATLFVVSNEPFSQAIASCLPQS